MAALHKYAYELWKILEADAKPDETFGEGLPIFRGKYTEAWSTLGASQTYYTRVRAYLRDNGYIQMLEQGSRNRDSIILLAKEPPQDVLQSPKENAAERLTLAGRFDTLEQQVQALRAWRESAGGINLQEALRNIERRLLKLEANGSHSGKNES